MKGRGLVVHSDVDEVVHGWLHLLYHLSHINQLYVPSRVRADGNLSCRFCVK